MALRTSICTLFLSLSLFLFGHSLEDALPGAQIGIRIIDLSTGRCIESHNGSKLFIPASTLKCVTTAAALTNLGRDYRFQTELSHNGYILNDTLHGSLIIDGTGDPSIDSTLCTELADRRISHITGEIRVSNPTEPSINPFAMIEDIGTDYGVGLSTFNYENNKALINDSLNAMPLQCVIDDFKADLLAHGITVGGSETIPTDTTVLIFHESKPLNELCRHMMTESDNLYAEAIGRSLSPLKDLRSATDSIKAFMKRTGIADNQYNITDMSGLSRTNYITPKAITRLLTAMSHNKDFVKCFPVAGREGTVKRFLDKSRLKGQFALKSGSMSGILAYAGYKIDCNGTPAHAIVIIVNNSVHKQAFVKQSIEKWLLKTFR